MTGASHRREPERSAPLMPDIIGVIGVALAVIGMSNIYLGARIVVLLASSVCMPASFFGRRDWPLWIRWSLSFASNFFLALVAWFYVRHSGILVR